MRQEGGISVVDIQIDNSKSFAVATGTGELSGATADDFTHALGEFASGQGVALVIELSGVDSIDSSGLGALIHLVTRSRLTHARVVLVAPSAFVRGVLGVTYLDHWFEICDSVHEAGKRLTC